VNRKARLDLPGPVRVLVLTFNTTLKGYIEALAQEQIKELEYLHNRASTLSEQSARASLLFAMGAASATFGSVVFTLPERAKGVSREAMAGLLGVISISALFVFAGAFDTAGYVLAALIVATSIVVQIWPRKQVEDSARDDGGVERRSGGEPKRPRSAGALTPERFAESQRLVAEDFPLPCGGLWISVAGSSERIPANKRARRQKLSYVNDPQMVNCITS
jgi:hypothetical protein